LILTPKQSIYMKNKIHLSIVSPVYRAENIVEELVSQISRHVQTITDSYEIVLVEDGSPDKSWEKMVECRKQYPELKIIKLSRNFGQHPAILAGLEHTSGEWVIVMDCDLQDNPEDIPLLYQKAIQEKYDIVRASRIERQDSLLKKMNSLLFFRVFSYLVGIKQDHTVANFGIYSRKVIKVVCELKEPFRPFTQIISWVGFHKCTIPVRHQSRFEGQSSYNFSKLINLALDIILSFSDKPLRLVIKMGLYISAFSLLLGIYVLIGHFMGRVTEPGYTSLFVSLWFLSGLIIFTLGLIGLYIGKCFEGIKDRPVYLADQRIGFDQNEGRRDE
jgi:polyisoprenyl-phosphate glycosyltransferase